MRKLLLSAVILLALAACNNEPADIGAVPENYDLSAAINELPVEKDANDSEEETNGTISSYNIGEHEEQNPLCNAISKGDLQTVKELIKNGTDVNKPEICTVYYSDMQDEGCDFSALSLAVINGNLDIVKELIKAGADINKKTHCETSYAGEGGDDWYPELLYIAVKGVPFNKQDANKDIAKALINAGANVDVVDENGNTLLELVDDTEITQLLLKYGAKDSLIAAINRKDLDSFNNLLKTSSLEDKNKALARTIALNNIPLTRQLINAGANVNANIDAHRYPNEGCPTETPLSVALNGKYTEMAALLKQKGAKEPLCTAIASQDVQRVRHAVQTGEDTNKEYMYCVPFDCFDMLPINQAIKTQNVEVIKGLVKLGAKVDLNNAFETVWNSGNLELIRYFIETGADINVHDKNGVTALMRAVTPKDIEITKLLLDKGADVNARDNEGRTPLFYAAIYSKDIAALLISKGADVNAKDSHGETPLSECSGRKEIEELLISKGADVNTEGDCGQTPLSIALMRGRACNEVVKLLISKGANVNYHINFNQPSCKKWPGDTALTATVARENTEIVKLLLDKGADFNEKNAEGETPLLIATKNEYNDIVQLLRSYGAKE